MKNQKQPQRKQHKSAPNLTRDQERQRCLFTALSGGAALTILSTLSRAEQALTPQQLHTRLPHSSIASVYHALYTLRAQQLVQHIPGSHSWAINANLGPFENALIAILSADEDHLRQIELLMYSEGEEV